MGDAKLQGLRAQGTSQRISLNNWPARPMNELTNKCFAKCILNFVLSVGLSGGLSVGKKRHLPIANMRKKLEYNVVLR